MNLPSTILETAESLAADGLGLATIRRALQMSAEDFDEAMKAPATGQKSALAQAIEDGQSRIVENALQVIIAAAQAGDLPSAKYLVERMSPRTDSKGKVQGVFINLQMPMSMDEYMKTFTKIDAEVIE